MFYNNRKMEQKMNILIAIPSHDYNIDIRSCMSIVSATHLLTANGIDWDIRSVMGSSILPHARNCLTYDFLSNEKFTHILWIDSDIIFKPSDLIGLIECANDKDIVCGGYLQKSDEGMLNVIFKDKSNSLVCQNTGCIEILAAGLGFCIMSRKVLETLQDKVRSYQDHGRKLYEFFKFDITYNEYTGEDIFIMTLARENGFKIWLYPNLTLGHVGKKSYTTNFSDSLSLSKL